MPSTTLSWGLLATGNIAEKFACGLAHSKSGKLAAVASRAEAKALEFGARHGLPGSACRGSYEALLADPRVEAVYISTPHPWHAEWCERAAAAGKHILCEKPLTMTLAEGERAIAAARRHRVLLMEAFMYRCAPLTKRVVELVRSGALGEVLGIQAAFSFIVPFNAESRLYNAALGGGGILDVGGYPVSFARLIAGAAAGKPFLDPVSVRGAGRLDPRTGVDVHAHALLDFPGGCVAQVSCGVGLTQDNSARIYGTAGWLHLPWPWIPAREGGRATFHHHRPGAEPETIHVDTQEWLYGLEADAVARALAAGHLETEEMSHADTLGNLAVLDRWAAEIRR